MTVLLASFAGLFGLAIGSFLNVVAHRVPLGMSLSHPPSSCPACGGEIAPRDNIPLVSWLRLGGRCRLCSAPIPIRYPLLELAGGLLWVGVFLTIGQSWILPAYLWFGSVTLALIATDLEHHRLPNKIVGVGVGAGAVLLAGGSLLDGEPLERIGWAILAGVAYFGLMLILALAVRGGFGFGDVKMAALLGLFVGYQPTLDGVGSAEAFGSLAVSVFVSFLIGGVVAIVLLALGQRGRRQEIAFGPAMILASWVAVAWGFQAFEAYVGI